MMRNNELLEDKIMQTSLETPSFLQITKQDFCSGSKSASRQVGMAGIKRAGYFTVLFGIPVFYDLEFFSGRVCLIPFCSSRIRHRN
jgi:hypothetical protein